MIFHHIENGPFKLAVLSAWNLEYDGTAHEVLPKAVDKVYAMPIE